MLRTLSSIFKTGLSRSNRILKRERIQIGQSHRRQSTSPTVPYWQTVKDEQKIIDERQVRIDLAAAYRLATVYNWEEGVCNHFTVSLPGNRFMVIPFGLHWTEVCASDLIIVDSKTGKVLDNGRGRGTVEPSATAFYLHSRIHLRRPETASCILHTHSQYATALTMVHGGKLEMVHQNSMRFQDQIAYDNDYSGLIISTEEGDRLANVLGDKNIMMMGNHGVLAVAPTISMAFNTLYYLERACMHQVLAMSTGLPLKIIAPNVLQEARKYFPGKEEKFYADNHFNSLKRFLDRTQPNYKE